MNETIKRHIFFFDVLNVKNVIKNIKEITIPSCLNEMIAPRKKPISIDKINFLSEYLNNSIAETVKFMTEKNKASVRIVFAKEV
tara:strand:- start:84 stop:335 length:252 start_codon:yes stop_codon:yes gene_type:complete